MLSRHACPSWTVAIVTFLTLLADGQSVISTHSGIIHFLEGAVYLGDQQLEAHPGRFLSVPAGSELRTAEGRAEVLLTPSVFVRIGGRSAIRMVDNELAHTRVELLAGSAIVDSAKPTPGTSVTLNYGNWSIRIPDQGVYRVDSDPPRLWVLEGRAEVFADSNGMLLAGQGMNVTLRPALVPEQTIEPPSDALSIWAEGRQQSVSADNAIAANIQDPASIKPSNLGLDSFTSFPALGLSVGPGLSTSSISSTLYQPGFKSLYLPGYTFLPFLLGLRSGGWLTVHLPFSLRPHPVTVFPVYPHPLPMRPVSPHPAPVRPVVPPGVHGGVHR